MVKREVRRNCVAVMSVPELGAAWMIASRAKTFAQQPPKIKAKMEAIESHDGMNVWAASIIVSRQLSSSGSRILPSCPGDSAFLFRNPSSRSSRSVPFADFAGGEPAFIALFCESRRVRDLDCHTWNIAEKVPSGILVQEFTLGGVQGSNSCLVKALRRVHTVSSSYITRLHS